MEQNLGNYRNNPYYNQNMFGIQSDLPNANTVMVLGICSIIVCALGPILGTIGIVLSSKAKKLYEANPMAYTLASFKQLSSGRICSIIGLCIGIVAWVFIIAYLIWVYYVISTINSQMEEALQAMPQ